MNSNEDRKSISARALKTSISKIFKTLKTTCPMTLEELTFYEGEFTLATVDGQSVTGGLVPKWLIGTTLE